MKSKHDIDKDVALAEKIFRRFVRGGGQLIATGPVPMEYTRDVTYLRYKHAVVDANDYLVFDDWLLAIGLISPDESQDINLDVFAEEIWQRWRLYQIIDISVPVKEWERVYAVYKRDFPERFAELRREYIVELVRRAKVPLTLKQQLKQEGNTQ